MIGYAKIRDREAFLTWLETDGWARRNSFYGRGQDGGWYYNHWTEYFYFRQKIFTSDLKNIFQDAVTDDRKPITEKFFLLLDYLESIDQKLEVYYRDETACIIGYHKSRYIFPTEWLVFEALNDYSGLTGPELKYLGNPVGMGNALVSAGDISVSAVQNGISEQETLLKRLEEEKKQVDSLEHEQMRDLKAKLDDLQREIEKRQQEIRDVLAKRMEEYLTVKKKLEAQLFLLDTQIYGIRCYLGEVLKFHKLLAGVRAADTEPVFIYQKIRYIDEELGKAELLYGNVLRGTLKSSFLELVKYNKDVCNLFLPDPRCITLFKVSRTGRTSGASDQIANMLSQYEQYHGSQLALMIRNGGEVHIAWLDEEKIHLSDENAFYSATRMEVSEYGESEVQYRTSKEEIASRYFLLSIMQGIADQGTILSFPEKVTFLNPDPKYVIFSMAEGWLKDNRYGMFSDIIKRVSEIPLKVGDMVLTGTLITRDDRYETGQSGRARRYEKFNNDRGIGERNRTHDASVARFQLLPVNKVLNDITVHFICDCIKVDPVLKESDTRRVFAYEEYDMVDTGEVLYSTVSKMEFDFDRVAYYKTYGPLSVRPTESEWMKLISDCLRGKYFYQHASFLDEGNLYESTFQRLSHTNGNPVYYKRVTGIERIEKRPHYYLSAVKEDSRWNDTDARANLEFEISEVIPLTYLCPTWVRYAITTGNIGNWYMAGTVLSYADSLKYLGIILRHLEDVYADSGALLAKAGLSQWIDSEPEWDVILTEWRIVHQVRKMTRFQAERFAKYLAEAGQ